MVILFREVNLVEIGGRHGWHWRRGLHIPRYRTLLQNERCLDIAFVITCHTYICLLLWVVLRSRSRFCSNRSTTTPSLQMCIAFNLSISKLRMIIVAANPFAKKDNSKASHATKHTRPAPHATRIIKHTTYTPSSVA